MASGTQKFKGTLPVLSAEDFPKEAKTKGHYTFKAKSGELKNALRKVVGIVPADKVVMRINGPKNPCLFKSPNGSDHIHIVMPMRA